MFLAMVIVGLAVQAAAPTASQVLDAEVYDHQALLDALRDHPSGRFRPAVRAVRCQPPAEDVVTCTFLWRYDRREAFAPRTQNYVRRPEGWRVYPTRLQLKDQPPLPEPVAPKQ